MNIVITHNQDKSRFEALVEGLVSVVDYVMESDNVLSVTHTGVPKELEGRGIAAQLTKSVLQYVRDKGLKIRPLCPYTAVYIEKHPEYKDLLAD